MPDTTLAMAEASTSEASTMNDLLIQDQGSDLASQAASLGITLPPTQDELPYDDGIPMETAQHRLQMECLIDTVNNALPDRAMFVGGNMFVYFSLSQIRNEDYRGPDFFAVLDVDRNPYRKSWVVWDEGKAPDVVIELLSESTLTLDKTVKKEIYQNKMRVPEYFWFDPLNPDDFAGFRLEGGVYQPIAPDEKGRLLSESLGLCLVPWYGAYKDKEQKFTWLRWETPDGVLIPTTEELATEAQQRAEEAQQRAEEAQQRAEEAQQRAEETQQLLDQERQKVAELTERLRTLGILPEEWA